MKILLLVRVNTGRDICFRKLHLSIHMKIHTTHATDLELGRGAGAVVRSLPLDPKVPGCIHGSAESRIFGDLLSR